MRIKTYTLLISGIFSVMLMPSASALEGGEYSYSGKWRPVQYQDSQRGRNVKPAPDPWAGVGNHAQSRPQSYSFRPWDSSRGQDNRAPARAREKRSVPFNRPDNGYPQRTASPMQAYWRPAAPAAPYAGFPAKDAGSQYRFRPMDQQGRRVAPMKWTYRPSQIEIPNHYVYRPLKVKRARYAEDQQRFKSPAAPRMVDYGFKPQDPAFYGYAPARAPFPGLAAPSYEPYRYVDRYNRYSADRLTGRYFGQPMASRYPYPRGHAAPRYTGQMPFAGYRFRPLNRTRWDGYPYRGQPDRYAANPYPVANYQRRLPGWGSQYGMQQAMGWPEVPNRYGVNWYDGRGDGEGAWYQLAGQQEWPRVSQYLPVD